MQAKLFIWRIFHPERLASVTLRIPVPRFGALRQGPPRPSISRRCKFLSLTLTLHMQQKVVMGVSSARETAKPVPASRRPVCVILRILRAGHMKGKNDIDC